MQAYTVYLYLETALHFSGGTSTSSGAHTTVSTASGICHTVTAICRYRGRVGTGLIVLLSCKWHTELKISKDKAYLRVLLEALPVIKQTYEAETYNLVEI
jgi:hypothetical protein